METARLIISYKDEAYSAALQKALILCGFDAELTNGNASDADSPDGKPVLTVSDESFPFPMPVSLIVNEIMARTGTKRRPAGSLNTLYTGFTAAIGGGGLTCCALCYARLRARLYDIKTAFVSFDPWFRNSFPESDEFGVVYLLPRGFEKRAEDFDELVLDIPTLAGKYSDLLDMCERRVVVRGFSEKRGDACDRLFEQMSRSSANYVNAPRNYILDNHYDSSSDTADIHTQLGKEINELAKRMEKEQA